MQVQIFLSVITILAPVDWKNQSVSQYWQIITTKRMLTLETLIRILKGKYWHLNLFSTDFLWKDLTPIICGNLKILSEAFFLLFLKTLLPVILQCYFIIFSPIKKTGNFEIDNNLRFLYSFRKTLAMPKYIIVLIVTTIYPWTASLKLI